MNVVNKIFKNIILQKINEKRENIVNCKLQYGFRPGKSTEDAVNVFCDKIKELKEDNCKYVMGIFFDIVGAFDNFWWPSLLTELKKKIGVYPKIWNLIKNYFSNRQIRMGTADGVVG
ncbi:MAG: hypothetical protein I4N51_12605 [Acinetobacter sp.]|nr:hypothetical protein [Acinetobacter sp.]